MLVLISVIVIWTVAKYLQIIFLNLYHLARNPTILLGTSSFCSKVLPSYSNITSYSNKAKNGWVVIAKYIAICEEEISVGVWHLCDFTIYHAWEELSVV